MRPHRRHGPRAGASPRARRRRSSRQLGGTATVRFTDADLDARTLRGLPGVDCGPPARPRDPRRGDRARCSPTSAPTSSPSAVRPLDLRVQRPSLEDRFVAITKEHSS